MSDLGSLPTSALNRQSQFAAGATEELLLGSRHLRGAFLQRPTRYAERGDRLMPADSADPEILLIRSGFAYRSCVLADGRRAIIDILTSGDVAGLDHVVLARPVDEFVVASRLGHNALPASEVRRLMAEPPIALYLYALLAEARYRANRLAIAIGRLDAQARICLMILDLYERLRRRDLIGRPTFNLPLTQEQIADHLGLTYVHVNRTLRRLREERLVFIDRHVVIILDLDRLRQLAEGLPEAPQLPEPPELPELKASADPLLQGA